MSMQWQYLHRLKLLVLKFYKCNNSFEKFRRVPNFYFLVLLNKLFDANTSFDCMKMNFLYFSNYLFVIAAKIGD